GNTASGDGGGVFISSPDNLVGGTSTAARNVISANDLGVDIGRNSSSDVTDNLVQGNYIGTDATGTADLGNIGDGVLVQGYSGNTVGGPAAGAENVISGNGRDGIELSATGATAVQGNLIGTDAAGTTALGNDLRGVLLNGAQDSLIGGSGAGEGNVISGNGNVGVGVDNAATGNRIEANLIGTDKTGNAPLGNAFGLQVAASSGNTIGGLTAAAGNTIAFNSQQGILLNVPPVAQNRIASNSIFSNGSLGIDLGADGVTANDSGDADTGPNNLQNFPVLAGVRSGTSTTVKGTLNSVPSKTYRLEFFSGPSCDSSGFGQGKQYLGSQNVTTNAGGNASFTATLGSGTSPGDAVTATATDPATNTSEFSRCATASIGKISARGTVHTTQGPSITFSAANDCTASLSTQPSIIGTTAGGRIWTKTAVTTSTCTDQPPASPLGFDTQTGTASGTFGASAPGGRNGQSGTLQWTYRDASPDTVQFTLRDSSNAVVYQANQQAPTAYAGSAGGVWTFPP
ncbi:MAG TPA: right-handed parallel beta-helix repeat-containing protein, partial [Gemmataceae bacterium]